ncbi:tyrosine-type recombinase/integrase, partial [Anaerorhabdus sp.]|uniref:tyrosine-type recombinase/integrase n=1 Tax=Anaerorhabdus sp. TaxID=1872524 RepID=UPI002FC6E8DB
ACKSEGLEFHMYQLRHLFGTDLVTSKVDSRTIQELMGHASYAMSVSYARSDEKRKKEALNNRLVS